MGKRLDITGKKFNKLTAIGPTNRRAKNGAVIWLFQCDCGEQTYRPATDVVSESIKSCEKCCKQNCFGGNRYTSTVSIQSVGEKSGMLSIVDVDFGDGSAQSVSYMCKCDCGNPKLVKISHKRFLNKKQLHSCGCQKADISKSNGKKAIHHRDITGMRVGMLTAIKCLEDEMKSTAKWLFLCDCGKEHEMQANDFERGRAYSCGCVVSLGETIIEDFFNANGVIYKQQVSFDSLVGINGGPLRFDFGVYNKDGALLCLIEFDGLHHYSDVGFSYNGVSVHTYTREHDRRRNEYCQKYGIKLHRLNDKKNIVRDLESILNSCEF